MRRNRRVGLLACAAISLLAHPGSWAATLRWDANGASGGQPNGSGEWLNANQWWTGSGNTSWTPGDDAVFGFAATAGGMVTLSAPTTVKSITINNFTGTYTLGTAGQAITLNQGITKNNGAIATLLSPVTLGGAQTWTNNSGSPLNATGGLDNGGHLLTIGGSGNTSFAGTANGITGAGGLVKSGVGTLYLGAGGETPFHGYMGPTTVNGGVVMLSGNKTAGNVTLNHGMLTDHFPQTTVFSGGLGAGNDQVQILGNSGFGGAPGASTWRIGASLSVLQWGGPFFNPDQLKFLTPADSLGPTLFGQVSLDNGLDLNDGVRTIDVLAATGANALFSSWARIAGNITSAGGRLIKTGGGNLMLSGENSHGGGTAISQGMLRFEARQAMPGTGAVTVSAGATLGVLVDNGQTGWGGGAGAGGIAGLANGLGGQGASTVSFSGASGLFLHVTADTTEGSVISNGGATSLSLTKFGPNRLTLAADNTFTGGVTVGDGALVLSGGNAIAGAVAVNAGTLQLAHTNAVAGAASLTLAAGTTLNLRSDTAAVFNAPAATMATAGTGTVTINVDHVAAGSGHTLALSSGLASSQNHGNISIFIFTGANGCSLAAPSLSINRFGGGSTAGGTILDPQTASVAIGPLTAAATQTLVIILDGNTAGNSLGGITQQGGSAAISLTKNDTSAWTINGSSAYAGATAVNAGKLFIQGNHVAAPGPLSVAANATLGGRGSLGGNVAVAANGRLEFDLSTPAGAHNPLDLAAGRTLTFSGASTLSITSAGGASPGLYTLVSAPGGITGPAPATLNLPAGWVASVSVVGTNLVLDVTSTGSSGGYPDWQAANGTAQNVDGDHDGDGVPNGIEWFLHGATASSGPDASPGVFAPAGALAVVWTRHPEFSGSYGVDYLVESADAPQGMWTPETLGGRVEIVGDEVRFTFATPLPDRKYARLKVFGP